jgi:hypothetical protein
MSVINSLSLCRVKSPSAPEPNVLPVETAAGAGAAALLLAALGALDKIDLEAEEVAEQHAFS